MRSAWLPSGMALMAAFLTTHAHAGEPPLPWVAEGLSVEVYVTLEAFGEEVPAEIAFDDQDNLYIGNFSLPSTPAAPAHVFRVSRVDTSVATFGAPIPDPDAVVVDRDGVLGASGSVIVAGAIAGCANDCTGRITEIISDGSSTAQLLQGGCLGNVQHVAFDGLGRLLAVNFNRGEVCVVENGSATRILGPVGSNVAGLAIDEQNNVYVAWDELVRKVDPTGTVVDDAFASGTPRAFGPSGPFQGVIVTRADSVLAIDPVTKEEHALVGAPGSVAFDSAGDMYVQASRRVLRVFAPEVAVPSSESHFTTPGPLVWNRPNPFRSATAITVYVSADHVDTVLQIFDVQGRIVRAYPIAARGGGSVTIAWDGRDGEGRRLPAGAYFYRLRYAGGATRAMKAVLVE